MTEDTSPRPIEVNLGPLNGLDSFCLHATRGLHPFRSLCLRGVVPEVVWDLRNVEPRHMSMAGLTAFLAVAERMRRFSGHPCRSRLRWNPTLFTFWDDIAFLKIARAYDLCEWEPEGILGGFSPGRTNPHTKILAFPFSDEVPDWTDIQRCNEWKDEARQEYFRRLQLLCAGVFRPRRNMIPIADSASNQIALTVSELIVNSLLWGRTPAFVGLQRSRAGISVAVCDTGLGFLRSLCGKQNRQELPQVRNNLAAVLWGSLINLSKWGLRQSIDVVTESEGWVSVASYDGEIRWVGESWRLAKSKSGEEKGIVQHFPQVQDVMREKGGYVSSSRGGEGYFRSWKLGLRGVRIAFEIPIRMKTEAPR